MLVISRFVISFISFHVYPVYRIAGSFAYDLIVSSVCRYSKNMTKIYTKEYRSKYVPCGIPYVMVATIFTYWTLYCKKVSKRFTGISLILILSNISSSKPYQILSPNPKIYIKIFHCYLKLAAFLLLMYNLHLGCKSSYCIQTVSLRLSCTYLSKSLSHQLRATFNICFELL